MDIEAILEALRVEEDSLRQKMHLSMYGGKEHKLTNEEFLAAHTRVSEICNQREDIWTRNFIVIDVD